MSDQTTSPEVICSIDAGLGEPTRTWYVDWRTLPVGTKLVRLDEMAAKCAELEGRVRELQQAAIVTDDGMSALQFVENSLRAIAERKEQIGDVIEPLNDIRAASKRAAFAIKRLGAIHAMLAAAPQPAQEKPTHRHIKTGGLYTELMRCRFESDGEDAVVYRGADGRAWTRLARNFDDPARFEKLEGKSDV